MFVCVTGVILGRSLARLFVACNNFDTLLAEWIPGLNMHSNSKIQNKRCCRRAGRRGDSFYTLLLQCHGESCPLSCCRGHDLF